MANELSLKCTIKYTPSATNQDAIAPAEFTKTVSMAGADHLSGTQSVGTSDESIVVGDVATLGYMLILNTDATNFVQVSSDAAPTNYLIRLNAGEFCLFRCGQVNTTLTAKADTAACVIQYWLFEA